MTKTAHINVRVTPEVKADAQALFARCGLSVSDAIQCFLHQSLLVGGLPFERPQPPYNHETVAAIQEAREIMHGTLHAETYASAAELFAHIENDA